MNALYRGIKNNSFWLIPLFSFICFVSLVIEYVLTFSFMATESDVFSVLGDFLSFLLPYAVALFMMVFGKIRGNTMMQNLIVLLAGIYLAVSSFKDGVSGIVGIATNGVWFMAIIIMTFILSLCWCFILFEGSFGYLQGNSERRLPTIAASGAMIVLIQTVMVVVTLAQAFVIYRGLDMTSAVMILKGIVPWSFNLALFFTFVDIHFIGSTNYDRKKKRKEENIDDLDIHTY